MATVGSIIRPRSRPGAHYYRDIDGIRSLVKHIDEVVKVEIDWSKDMAPTESISTVEYDASGVTVSSETVNGAETSCVVTGVGSLEVKATTDLSRVLVEQLRFYEARK